MFEAMKLRQRILLGYLAPLVLLLGAIGLVFVNLQEATHASAAAEASHLTMDEARDLAYSLAKMQRAAHGYLLMKTPTARQTFADSEKDVSSRGEKLAGMVKDPQQQETLRGMLKLGNELGQQDKQAGALAHFRSGEGIKESAEIDALWNRFKQRETAIVKERQETYDAAMRTVANSIVYGMLGAIALAIAITVWLAAAVSRNISVNAAQLSAATVKGDETTRQAVAAMGNLKDKIDAMAAQIFHLGEQIGQISSIATVLKDLTGQINMLALNAAVEAARAGEHGKGFAVVAGEIRKLVDESKKSAEQTAVLVADIQKTTNLSIMMTEEGTRTVAEVTQLVQKVAQLFNSDLARLIGSANENAQQVMFNARQQSAAFSQTKIGVQNLNEAAANLKAIA